MMRKTQNIQNYVRNKVATGEWPGGISAQWLDDLSQCSNGMVGGIARYAALWLQRRSQGGISRQVPCATCAKPSCAFPLGGNVWSQCESCIAQKSISAVNLPEALLGRKQLAIATRLSTSFVCYSKKQEQ